MDHDYFQRLAVSGLSMPIGMDLMLHSEPAPQAVRLDGAALGSLLARAARRFNSPLAIPLMDLQLEKALLLRGLDLSPEQATMFHFETPPTDDQLGLIRRGLGEPLPALLQAQVQAIAHVAEHETDVVPCAMTIGPFSLVTKLLSDPIAAVYLSGRGVGADEDQSVACLEPCLDLAMEVVELSLRAQLAAGAKVAFLAEPAANRVYLSPRQMGRGSDIFDRLVLANLIRYAAVLREFGAELWLHDCGELTDEMIRGLCTVHPAVLSLGSSRPLWEVAPLVPSTTVLYGNLPSKQFSSDAAITVEQVRAETRALIQQMHLAGRPFILGTECDVLHVPGQAQTIWAKVDAFMRTSASARAERSALMAVPEQAHGTGEPDRDSAGMAESAGERHRRF